MGHPRLRCSKSTTVEEMIDVYEEFMQMSSSRDLLKLLHSLRDIRWKHAPKLPLMVEASTLVKGLIARTSCLKIPHVVARSAALACHASQEGCCLYDPSSYSIETLAMMVSFRVRCVLSKYRQVKADSDKLAIVLAKASVQTFKHWVD